MKCFTILTSVYKTILMFFLTHIDSVTLFVEVMGGILLGYGWCTFLLWLNEECKILALILWYLTNICLAVFWYYSFHC